MADLERRSSMEPVQLAVVVVGTGLGVPMLTMSSRIVEIAGQTAWFSLLLGAVIYGSAACGLVRLGRQYPGDTLVEYLPKLLGRQLGRAIAVYIFLLYCLEYCVVLRGFTNIIVISLFDRTPFDVIAMAMLAMSAYGAMQKWGTILRIIEYFVVSAIPSVIVIWSAAILNFNNENVLPFWPESTFPILTGALQSISYFTGYKLLLVVLPLMQSSSARQYQAVGGAFAFLGLVYALSLLIMTGVLGVASINTVTYPLISAIRGIEIPGFFLERLENYLLLAWIPIAFDTLMLILFCAAQVAMRLFCQTDHRPQFVLVLPFLFIIAMLLDRKAEFDAVTQVISGMEGFFVWGILPLCLALIWLRRKNG